MGLVLLIFALIAAAVLVPPLLVAIPIGKAVAARWRDRAWSEPVAWIVGVLAYALVAGAIAGFIWWGWCSRMRIAG